MEISIGEYVKFLNGYIGKVENINDFREPSMKYAIDIQKDDLVFVGEDYIVKHSKDIIDLIEAGDYVNGEPVEKIETGLDWGREITTTTEYLTNNEDIQSIITKEQIKQIEFRIKE